MQQVNKQKAVKSEYDKITNETNTRFIDLAFIMSAPEENDTKKKKFLYDQLKVDHKVRHGTTPTDKSSLRYPEQP